MISVDWRFFRVVIGVCLIYSQVRGGGTFQLALGLSLGNRMFLKREECHLTTGREHSEEFSSPPIE